MPGSLIDILVSEQPKQQLGSKPSAQLQAGKGIVGDRYFNDTGTFSEKLKGLPDREVTLIEQEEIDSFNKTTLFGYDNADFRRNLVTRGIRLNDLVGKTFKVGSVQLKGIRLAEPCSYLASLLGREVLDHMIHKAGLRAQILSDGIIQTGDTIS